MQSWKTLCRRPGLNPVSKIKACHAHDVLPFYDTGIWRNSYLDQKNSSMTTFMKSQPNSSRPWKKALLLVSVACSLAIPAWASLPSTSSSNLVIVNGSGTTTSTSGSTLTVNTNGANNVVLSWTHFWDGTTPGGTSASTDVIDYVLPSASSSILNQVTGSGLTTINGKIESNGNVYLINPNGVTVGSTGVVNTAGFGVSTDLEPLSTFESTGSLAVFTAGSSQTANLGTGVITTSPGAVIETIGGSGGIWLAANAINISSALQGNVLLVNGGSTPGNIDLGVSGPATVQSGNLTIWGNGGAVFLGDTASDSVIVEGTTTIAANAATNVTVGSAASTTFQGAASISSDGGAISVSAGAPTLAEGSLTLTNSGAGTTTLSAGGATTVQGNLTITNATGNVDLANTDNTSVSGNTSVTTTTGNVVDTAGMFTANALGTTATFTTTSGNVTLADADIASVAANSTSGNFSLTDPTTNAVALATSNVGTGNFTVSASTLNSSGTVTAANFTATQTTGNFTLPAATVTGQYKAIATAGNITGGSGITDGTLWLAAPAGSINFNTSGTIDTTWLHASTSVTLTATGNVTLAPSSGTAIQTPTLTVTSSGGNITDAGAGFATTVATASFSAPSGTITLGSTTTPDLYTTVSLAGQSAALINGQAVSVGTGTNTSGNLAVTTTAGSITLGSSAASTINVGGALTLTSAAAVSTTADNVTVTGNVTVTAGGNVTLGNTDATTNFSFGQIAITAPTFAAAVYEDANTSLGAINAGTLLVDSTGNISNPSGVIGTGAETLTSGTTSSPGSITLGSTTTPADITGLITIDNGSNVAVVNSVTTSIASAAPTTSPVTSIWADVTAPTGTLAVDGNVSQIGFTVVNGAVTIGGVTPDAVPLTLWNAVNPSSSSAAVTVTAAKAVTLGSGISLASSGGLTINNSGGSGSISDTASSPVSISGPVTLDTAGAINIANNTANSLGSLSFTLATGDNSNITYVEGSTVNLAALSLPAAYTGTVSLTSETGNVIESAAISVPTTATALNLSAPAGVVTFNLANTIGAAVPVGISAMGNSSLFNGNSTLLGNVNVTAGGLTVNTSAGAAATITQATGTSINSWGNPDFVTALGAITLTNSGNNFGAISVDTTNGNHAGDTAGANVAIDENATDSYAAINTGTAGNFSATATSGDIIEKTAATVAIGGTTSLTSSHGNITWTSAANTLGGTLWFVAPGNVSVDTTGSITLAGTSTAPATVGGNLTLIAGGTTSSITDSGTAYADVTGSSSFTAGSGGISLTNDNGGTGGSNYAGALMFNTTGAVTFKQVASINLGASAVSGAASLTTDTGNFTNSAVSYFLDTLTISAVHGSIIFVDPINVDDGLTVTSSTGPVNLSVDSLSHNLDNIAPTGTGTALTNYTAPSP